jgi:hypothetical protein
MLLCNWKKKSKTLFKKKKKQNYNHCNHIALHGHFLKWIETILCNLAHTIKKQRAKEK